MARFKCVASIIDFRGVTDLFVAPDFDGDPVVIYNPNPGDPVLPPEDEEMPDPP